MSERSKGKAGADRRVDERIPAQIRVRLKYPDVETFLERYATNISRGGIFIQTQRTKPPGTLIRFEFQLQDASPVIRGEGRVSWVVAYDAAHAERAYGMGVKFTRLDARSKQYIDRIVAQKVKRGQADNPTAPPAPDEATLGPVRDVTGNEAATPLPAIRGAEPPEPAPADALVSDADPGPAQPLAAAPGAAAAVAPAPAMPADIDELLSGAPAIERRPLSVKILGTSPHDVVTLDRLLGEIESAVAATGRPIVAAPARRGATSPRRSKRATTPPVTRSDEAVPASDSSATGQGDASAALSEGSADDSAAPSGAHASGEVIATGDATSSSTAGPSQTTDAPVAVDSTPAEPAPAVPSIDERIDRFLDETSLGSFALDLEEMPAPPPLEAAGGRRPSAPPARRISVPPARRRSEESASVPPPATAVAAQVALAPLPAPIVPAPVADPEPVVAASLEDPPALTLSPGELSAAVEAAAETGLADLGLVSSSAAPSAGSTAGEPGSPSIDDPFGMREEDDAFSMDVGPLLEDSESGPPSEQTAIGGAEAVAFYEGDAGNPTPVPDVPDDAGAQAGLPILDEPLVDDFERSPVAEVATGAELDEAFGLSVPLDALSEEEPAVASVNEPLPELDIDDTLLDAAAAFDPAALRPTPPPLVRAETVPAEVAPSEAAVADAAAGEEAPKKGFFRKLFGNK